MAKQKVTFRLEEDFVRIFRKYCKAKALTAELTQAEVIELAMRNYIQEEIEADELLAKLMEK